MRFALSVLRTLSALMISVTLLMFGNSMFSTLLALRANIEGYPNEMVRACLAAGLGVEGVPIADEIEMMGIKTPETLASIREIVDND